MQYLRAFVRWWWIVLLGVALGAALGASAIPAVSTSYTSTAGVSLTPTQRATATPAEAYSSQLLAQTRAASYAGVAVGEDRLEEIIDDLDLDLTTAQLSEQVEVTAAASTSLITIRVTADDPDAAQQVADGLVRSTVQTVRGSEQRPNIDPLLRPVIANPPSEASASDVPPDWRNPAYGAGGGLLVGLGLAVVAGRLDRRVRRRETAEEDLDAPVLGSVPVRPSRGGRRTRSGDAVAEAVQALRTSLFFPGDRGGRISPLAVVSSRRGPDLAPLALELSGALAGTGAAVLIVECDLQQPSLADAIGWDPTDRVGLAAFLDGSVGRDEVVHPHPSAGFDVVLAGEPRKNTANVLHSRQLADLLDDATRTYDFVVVTAPPVLDGTDAAAVAARCAGTLVTVELGRTRRDDLRATAEQLGRVNAAIVGSVTLR